MVEGGEAIGEAVTAGIAARAVEPVAGEASTADRPDCLNCRTALAGDYCHHCGQPGHVHRTVSAWWHDVAHGVLHFEGKIWRTLPLLAWRPGELTRRFIEGERARFVSPMALFLFTVFLMFAVFSAIGTSFLGFGDPRSAEEAAAEIRRTDQRIAQLEGRGRELASQGRPDPSVANALEEARMERRMAAIASGQKVFEGEPNTGWARFDEALKKANENPALVAYKLQTNAYKFSWALIPISLPFLWLLFLHKRRYRERYKAFDHLVFVTYSISFMSMVLIALVLLGSIGISGGLLNVVLLAIPPIHIFRQLRGAYGLSRLSTLWRTAALVAMAMLASLLFMLLLIALGLFA
ncbi:DUF3667 domain-containing protein [Allosphingosinicella sp.]|jgi:hypothetical protein|uniref:DUF3667 domain-containing protein n=1 Tax=Allosphingosinicella sp. TaxID=2823234 RepID=UPI002EF9FE67